MGRVFAAASRAAPRRPRPPSILGPTSSIARSRYRPRYRPQPIPSRPVSPHSPSSSSSSGSSSPPLALSFAGPTLLPVSSLPLGWRPERANAVRASSPPPLLPVVVPPALSAPVDSPPSSPPPSFPPGSPVAASPSLRSPLLHSPSAPVLLSRAMPNQVFRLLRMTMAMSRLRDGVHGPLPLPTHPSSPFVTEVYSGVLKSFIRHHNPHSAPLLSPHVNLPFPSLLLSFSLSLCRSPSSSSPPSSCPALLPALVASFPPIAHLKEKVHAVDNVGDKAMLKSLLCVLWLHHRAHSGPLYEELRSAVLPALRVFHSVHRGDVPEIDDMLRPPNAEGAARDFVLARGGDYDDHLINKLRELVNLVGGNEQQSLFC